MHRPRLIALTCALASIPAASYAREPSATPQDEAPPAPPPLVEAPTALRAAPSLADEYAPSELLLEVSNPSLTARQRRHLRMVGMAMTVGGFTAAAAGGILAAIGGVVLNSHGNQSQTLGVFTLGFGIALAVGGGTIGIVGIPIWVTGASRHP